MSSISSLTGKGNKGFTLIEVLIAVGLTAVLLAAFYTTFFSVMGAARSAEEELSRTIEAGRFLTAIRRELRSSYFKPADGLTRLGGERKAAGSTITFTYMAEPGKKKDEPLADLVAVSYYAREKEGTIEVVKEVSSPFGGEKFTAGALEGLRSFEVGFFNGKDWSRAWDSAAEGRPPQAVRVDIGLKSGTVFTIAPVMVR